MTFTLSSFRAVLLVVMAAAGGYSHSALSELGREGQGRSGGLHIDITFSVIF
ncbi:MAG TPA: hypothetical protein VHO46_00070 [Bacteroidales bacterium]|nr:hypothetical protein [Bacteroidales bacterium]